MNNKVILSIITPVYNRTDCIERCLNSVSNQLTEGIEHIVIDDGSQDNTAMVVQQYAKEKKHITFYQFPENRGTNAARNYAISKCSGLFILILDSDDTLATCACQNILSIINQYPSITHFLFQVNDRLKYYQSNSILKTKEFINYTDWLNRRVSGDFCHVIKTSVAIQFPFDEELRIYEGLNFLRIYKSEQEQLYIEEIILNRDRTRGDSVTNTIRLYKKNAIKNLFLYYNSLISENIENIESNILHEYLNKAVLLGIASFSYPEIKELLKITDKRKTKINISNKILYHLKLSYLLNIFLKTYSFTKAAIIK